MLRRRATVVSLALALSGASLLPASATATFHEISIREVYPGSVAQPDAEYVELQMWTPGQNFVSGHVLKTYDKGGGVTSTDTFTGDVPNGANQSTILIATPAAESAFGVTADLGLSANKLDPTGGAVCWEALDCVSWGSFGGASLPSPAGTPAAAIADGMALRRTITPGCPTSLEPSDDHDNSAADFSAVFPAPRPNSTAPAERRCPGTSESGFGTVPGGSGQHGAPQTRLQSKPAKKLRNRRVTFRFASNEPGSTFQCKLDGKPFKACKSPLTIKHLSLGPHTFKVRARDDSGKLDPKPASYRFEVVAKRQSASGR
jgi:hypothetical protein